MRRTPIAIAWTVPLLTIALGGCAGPDRIDEGVGYPTLTQSAVLDVQAFRDETELTITNTSERAIGSSRLWINQRYSRELPGLGVGATATLDLFTFKDRYGESFRAGGFFATDRPDRIVLVQVQEGDTLTGLVIVGQDN